MWQIVIVLQYDTLPQRIWSFSVNPDWQWFCGARWKFSQNQWPSSVLLLCHMNDYMSVSQNAV